MANKTSLTSVKVILPRVILQLNCDWFEKDLLPVLYGNNTLINLTWKKMCRFINSTFLFEWKELYWTSKLIWVKFDLLRFVWYGPTVMSYLLNSSTLNTNFRSQYPLLKSEICYGKTTSYFARNKICDSSASNGTQLILAPIT